ncbi:MAG: MFS transporter [Thermaerobacterales bacterium]
MGARPLLRYQPPLGVLVMLIAFIATGLRIGIVPFFPELREAYGIGNAEVGLLFSAFFVTFTLLQFPAGFAADRLPARRVLLASLLGLIAATFLFLLTTTWPAALTARLLMGACAAWIFPTVVQWILRAAPPRRHASIFGLFETGIALAFFVSLSIVPLLAAYLGLHSSHVVLGVMAFAVAGLLARSIALRSHLPPPPDPAANEGDGVWRAPSPYTRYSVARRLTLLVGLTAFATLPAAAVMTWTPTYLYDVLRYDATAVGLTMGLLTGTYVIVAYLSGRWADERPRLPIMNTGAALAFFGIVALLVFDRPPAPVMGAVAVLLGAGFALSFTPFMVFVAQLFGPRRAGVSAALMTTTAQLSNIAAGVLFGWIIDMTGRFTLVWVIAALCSPLRVAVCRLVEEVLPDAVDQLPPDLEITS